MEGHKAPTITRLLREQGVTVSHVGFSKFLAKFKKTGSIRQRIGSGRPWKIMAERKKLVEDQMYLNVERTVYQLHKLPMRKDNSISLQAVLFVN